MSGTGRERASGLGLAVASALCFGGSGPVAKPLIEAGLDPLHVTWLRVAGTALVLLPLAIRHRSVLRTRPWLLLAYGVFPMAGVQALYFAAISRIPVGVALLLEFLGPVLVLAWIRVVRRHAVSRSAAVGVIMAVAGLACLVEVWAGVRLDPLGIALGLAAAACQAGYFLLSDSAGDEVNPLSVIAFGSLVATVLITVIAQPWTMDWALLAGQVPVAGARAPALVTLAWLVVVSTALAYISGVAAIRRLSPVVAGAVAYLEVVTAIVLAWLMLGEALSTAQIVGAVIVVAGAFIAQTSVTTGAAGGADTETTDGPAPVSNPAVGAAGTETARTEG